MRKKSSSQFGFLNPRVCVAFLLCVGGVSMAVLSFAKPVRSTAPSHVILTEFSDFQCPYCKQAAGVIDQIRKAYGERVKVVFKQMPLRLHEYAFQAARASVCASEQGRFWQYHDRLFASADLSANALKGIAAEVELKENAFNECMASDRSLTAVEKDIDEAERLGVHGTPTFFVNGRAIRGASTFAALKREIDGAAVRLNDATMAIRQPQDVWQRLKHQLGGTLGLVQEAIPRQPAQLRDLGDALEVRSHPAKVVASITTAGVILSPSTINFGYQLVGTAGPPVTETVTNAGTGPLVITDISVSGHDRGNFTPHYNFSLPVTVAPGQSITINLTFTPSLPWRAGTRNARLEISEQRNSQYLSLTGIGATCLGPLPACSSGCPDTDGDGLNDAWEIAGGIDLDNDGVIDATKGDLLLPGANSNSPDIYVWYDWMDYGLDGQSCGTNSDCYPDSGLYHLGETCNQGQCVYSCSTDSDCTSRRPTEAHAGERCINNICEHTHDPLIADPNVFQPVIERFAAHGINLHMMRGNAQPHSHVLSFRRDAQMTPNCEGATGPNVGLGKYAVSVSDLEPRSNPDKFNLAYHYVIFAHYSGCDSVAHCPMTGGYISDCPDRSLTFGQAGDAYLSGNDFIVSLGGLVNDSALSLQFQTAGTFMHELGHNLGLRHDGHLDTPCRTNVDCRSGDTCTDLGDGQGRVCHETFHGVLGAEEPNYKPNYLSVMNYMYEAGFIQIGASVGSRVPQRCSSNADCGGNGAICVRRNNGGYCSVSDLFCTTTSDCPISGESCVLPPNTCITTGYVCVTDSDCTNGDTCLPPSPGYCARIDYSSQTLPVGGNIPGALDEANLDDPLGLGSGTADLFNYWDARCHACPLAAPTSGPVNWAGTGVDTDYHFCSLYRTGNESFTDTGVQADIDWGFNGTCGAPWDVLHGHTDWPDLSGIAFNYKFQCAPNGAQ